MPKQKPILVLTILIIHNWTICIAQNWIDSSYQTSTTKNIVYGNSADFAANARDLEFDISQPINDNPPDCGRPLVILIHGGAFLAGSKDDQTIATMREKFAQKGYVAVALNYRLGMFHTEKLVNCNVSALGVQWNCLNITDTAEWYRAYFRGVQDVHGAIRYLVDRKSEFKIDPSHVFVVGESAGGFIAMGVGFMDDSSEVLTALVDDLNNVKPPNNIYQSPCIQAFNLDTAIASMNLKRSNLGSFRGDLNPTNQPYQIRGVGSMFGAVFNPIFLNHSTNLPALYLYHQPNDLIVPFNNGPIFSGFVTCMSGFPFNCGNIINRPKVVGSKGIYDLLQTMERNGQTIPELQFDETTNNANCAQQLGNGSLSGHGYDNFNLRLKNMAVLFANQIDSCSSVGFNPFHKTQMSSVHPIPVSENGILKIENVIGESEIQIIDNLGFVRLSFQSLPNSKNVSIKLSDWKLSSGIYFLQVQSANSTQIHKLMITGD